MLIKKKKNFLNNAMDAKQASEFFLDNKKYAIYVDHLKVYYEEKTQNETLVFTDVNQKFEKGKIYFIVGDSGAGKTTLVAHFNGLLKSKYGNIFVDDSKIIGKKRGIKNFKKMRRSVGMVFQFPEYQLFKSSVIHDVMFGPRNLGVKRLPAMRRAYRALLQMNLDPKFYRRSPFDLSGGQKRRVAIAGILAIDPSIFVFDEPAAGLDPEGINEMLNIIHDLNKKGKTIFVITHDMNHVLQLADKVIFIANKTIAAFDEPYKIFTNSEILKNSTLIKPNVIRTIEKLVEKNPKFNKLYDLKPRNVNELAIAIDKVIKGEV